MVDKIEHQSSKNPHFHETVVRLLYLGAGIVIFQIECHPEIQILCTDCTRAVMTDNEGVSAIYCAQTSIVYIEIEAGHEITY